MTTKLRLAAVAAALALTACGADYGTTAGRESMADQMVSPDLMLPDGEVNDATGTEIP